MRQHFVEDMAGLPTHGFGPRSITWWGTYGFILIEATVFVLAAAAYFYLKGQVPQWPPEGEPPDLLWGTLLTVVLLLSALPNIWMKRAAESEDATRSRVWLVVLLAFGAALIAIRVFEFGTLNCRWDSNAYGSIIWTTLGLHTLHLVTDFGDSAVLTTLAFTHEMDGRRFADVSEDAIYWNFVVALWLPVYLLLYWVPRLT